MEKVRNVGRKEVRYNRLVTAANTSHSQIPHNRVLTTSKWCIIIGRYETPSLNIAIEMLSGKPG